MWFVSQWHERPIKFLNVFFLFLKLLILNIFRRFLYLYVIAMSFFISIGFIHLTFFIGSSYCIVFLFTLFYIYLFYCTFINAILLLFLSFHFHWILFLIIVLFYFIFLSFLLSTKSLEVLKFSWNNREFRLIMISRIKLTIINIYILFMNSFEANQVSLSSKTSYTFITKHHIAYEIMSSWSVFQRKLINFILLHITLSMPFF